jgi:LysM repeat protein
MVGDEQVREVPEKGYEGGRAGATMITGKRFHLVAVCLGGLLLSGCVMSEKYEAEKARALNFQRLLAQEEKRTGELDSELKRVKRDAAELEAKNRQMAAQLQAVREQMAGLQEETMALREAAALKEREGGRTARAAAKPKRVEPEAPPAEVVEGGASPENGTPIYHEVKPGETLFRLSRQYRVDVGKIRSWNNLPDNTISVGQQLIVGYE